MKFKDIREKYRSKFPTSLVAAAVKIALDMGGNMTGAYKKIEAMKRGLGDDPAVKDALRLANESVSEDFAPRALNSLGAKNYSMTFTKAQPKSLAKFLSMIKGQEKFGAGIKVKNVKKGLKGSTIVFFTSGSNLQIKALQNALDKVMKQFNESLSNTQEIMVEEKEIPFGYTFFDKGDVDKFKRLIGGLKGLELVSVDKMKGGQFTVRVKGPRKIVAKANAFAIRVMAENNGVNEAKGEFPSSMTYFNKKGATKAEKIAKGLKIYKNTKEVGKGPNFAYTVHVMGSFDKIEKWIDLI